LVDRKIQAGLAGESSCLFPVASPVGVRRVSVPGRGDPGGGALIPALRPVLPRRRGAAGRTPHRGQPRHGLPLGAAVHPLPADAARFCRHGQRNEPGTPIRQHQAPPRQRSSSTQRSSTMRSPPIFHPKEAAVMAARQRPVSALGFFEKTDRQSGNPAILGGGCHRRQAAGSDVVRSMPSGPERLSPRSTGPTSSWFLTVGSHRCDLARRRRGWPVTHSDGGNAAEGVVTSGRRDWTFPTPKSWSSATRVLAPRS
jgi:hypothetical protein